MTVGSLAREIIDVLIATKKHEIVVLTRKVSTYLRRHRL